MRTKIKLTVLAFFSAVVLISCSDEYLEVEPRGTSLEANYYRNQQEAYAGLVAAYDPVGWIGGNYVAKEFALNVASDDFYAGGGNSQDVPAVQAWSSYTIDPAVGPQEELWRKGFSGVYRANVLLSKLPDTNMDEQLKERYVAEMKFLRAYYYFDLIRLFYEVPLFTKPLGADEINNAQQVERAAVYAQIEQDLMEAIPNLPTSLDLATEAGRATQGAGKALLGKVYLNQEKFGQAVEQFQDVNGTPGETSQYGYRLLDNFGDLFENENQFNSESIFEVVHTSASNWGDWGCIGCTEGNFLNQMSAPRGYSINEAGRGAPDFIAGWGFNVPTQRLVDAFIAQDGTYDQRYKHTISNIDSLAGLGVVSYEESYQGTGYFLKKFAGTQDDRHTGAGNYEGNWPQNFYDIRLADTYLLEAEALVRGGGDMNRAQALLNAVRTRSGNAPVTVNFDNILRERRLELAGEGHRWFDLQRAGLAPTYLEFKGYVREKHDKLPIPLLDLTNTLLEQDPAYQ